MENYSGRKNLEFLYAVRNKNNKKAIENAMQLVKLDYDSGKWVGKYSLGMKQRLAIAQAFMEEQKLLILDEPMNGLDSQGIQDIRELFLNLKKQGKTILLASHNREDMEILCDKVCQIKDGRLIMD